MVLNDEKKAFVVYKTILSNLAKVLVPFVMVAEEVQTLKFTNSEVIDDSNRVETYVLLELFLNTGRIISYVLLFIVGIYNNLYLLEILIIFLVMAIVAETINLIKFNKGDQL